MSCGVEGRLTSAHRLAARSLRLQRPPVLTGTRVIVDDAQRKAWYEQVTKTMQKLAIPGKQVNAFCDLAGVPD